MADTKKERLPDEVQEPEKTRAEGAPADRVVTCERCERRYPYQTTMAGTTMPCLCGDLILVAAE